MALAMLLINLLKQSKHHVQSSVMNDKPDLKSFLNKIAFELQNPDVT
jgi:hypothetical protein